MCSGGVEDILEQVEALLAGVEHAELVDVPLERLAGVVERVSVVSHRVDALRVAVTGTVDSSGVACRDGLRATSWITHRTRRRRGGVAADLHHARVLRHLPCTAAAFAAGTISQAHVAALAALHRGALAVLLRRDEWFLVATAVACPYAEFVAVLERWRNAADPDGPEPVAEQRSFRLRRSLTGRADGELRTDDLTAAEILALLAPIEQALWDADWADARARHGTAATDADLARSPDQRRHDALLTLLRRGAANPNGLEPRPVLNVIVPLADLQRLLTDTAGLPVDPVDPTGVGPDTGPRLADGTPLTDHQTLELLVRGFIRRVVVDPAGRPVAIHSRQRCFTGPLRDILLALNRTCAFPGCDTPTTHCELDHIHPWRHDGPTHAANAQPLCPHHQQRKEAGFTHHPHADGTTHWTRPDTTPLE
jgi:hypothetical protein